MPATRPPPDAPAQNAAPSASLPALDPRVGRLLEQLEEAERWLPEALEAREEAIHKLRVALRRTRVLARQLESCGGREGARMRDLRNASRALFRALGGLRDLDILAREWTDLQADPRLPRVASAELPRWLALERLRLRSGLPDAAEAFREAVHHFRARGGAHEHFRTPGRGARSLRRRARRFVTQLEAIREEPRDEELHRLRIRGKQLRYALEAVEDGEGGFLESRLKKLQDGLGSLQDAVTVVARFEALGAGGILSPTVAGLARAAAVDERDRRRARFLSDLDRGTYDDLLKGVNELAAKKGDGEADSEARNREEEAVVPLEKIPGIGAAKARRLADAGLATPEAIRAASVSDLAAIKAIGPHQARLIKDYVERQEASNGPRPASEEPDGKRFERTQSALAVAAAVADYARSLAEELSRQEAGDATRAARQAERLAELLTGFDGRLADISTKDLKGLRGELRETEGLLAKVLDLDTGSLKMNKIRKALKAHRKAIEIYLA